MGRQFGGMFEEEDGGGDEVQACRGLGQSLIFAGEAAEAGESGEGKLRLKVPR